ARATKVRTGQIRYIDRTVPELRSQAPVQRRLPKGPLHAFARWPAGSKLPLCGSGTILQAYTASDANDGATAATAARSFGHHGVDGRRGCKGRPISTLSMRERQKVSILS